MFANEEPERGGSPEAADDAVALSTPPGGRWGALPEEWAHFAKLEGVADRLLPVVSNPGGKISTGSSLKSIGKTPSLYNAEGKVVGVKGWTQREAASPKEIAAWARQPDYGLCIRTGGPLNLVAIDIDIDEEREAQRVEDMVWSALGDMPVRSRSNSGKRVMLCRVEGETLRLRLVRTAHGLVELRAELQQVVVCGTHTSGVRYEMRDGLPDDFPIVPSADFETLWTMIAALDVAGKGGHRAVARETGEAFEADDECADWLLENWPNYGYDRKGQLMIECPFISDHSSDNRPTETVYMPKGSRGFGRGHYKCQHASCTSQRTDDDFDRATGYAASDLVDLTPLAPARDESVPPPGRLVYNPKDPLQYARGFAEHCFTLGGRVTLVRSCGLWYEHQERCYRILEPEALRKRAWGFLDKAARKGRGGELERFAPTPQLVTGMLDALLEVGEFVSAAPPAWLPGAQGPDPAELVVLNDGILDLATRQLMPHTPKLFAVNALPFAWEDGDRKPVAWLRFLESVWPGDVEAQNLVQEWFGYCLTADTSQQKALMIVGPKRSGKSTVGRILRALLGEENVAAPTMNGLTGEFGLQPLIGKLAAIIADARTPSRSDNGKIVERLLMLTGEDLITVNRKRIDMWTGKLDARVMLMTNEVVRFNDASGALASRFLTLETSRSFYGSEDPHLTAKLLAELPAIFRWAIEGRDRLKARGHFVQPSSGERLAEELRMAGSPLAQFVSERCYLDPEASIVHADLFDSWRRWCSDNGHHAGGSSYFSTKLHEAFPQISTRRPRGDDGSQVITQFGVGLNALKNADMPLEEEF